MAAGRTVAAGSHGRGTGRPFMAEVFAMSRFRPAGFRNGRTAWRRASRRASRPVSGRPARRRSTAFRDGWNRIAAAGPHGTPLRLGTRSRHGRRAPAERRFTVGGKSVARCHRTMLAYWKFESISLQRRVHANQLVGPRAAVGWWSRRPRHAAAARPPHIPSHACAHVSSLSAGNWKHAESEKTTGDCKPDGYGDRGAGEWRAYL